MSNAYQQGFQQPQWNTATGAMLCDSVLDVTMPGFAEPLPAGTNQLGTVTTVGAVPSAANLVGNVGAALPAGATPFTVRATSAGNTEVTATQPAASGQQNYGSSD